MVSEYSSLMSWNWLYILPAILLLPYVLGPFLIKSILVFDSATPIELLHPTDARMGAGFRHFVARISRELAPLGYQVSAYLYIPRLVSNIQSLLVYFHRDGEEDAVAIMAGMTGDSSRIQCLVVEFCTVYENGTVVDTSNSSDVEAYQGAAYKSAWKFPGLAELPLLQQAHQAHKRERGGGPVKPPVSGVMIPAYLEASFKREFQALSEAGTFTASADGTRFRLSWPAAFTGTWGQCWPVSRFRRAALRRHAHNRLMALNLADGYSHEDYLNWMKARPPVWVDLPMPVPSHDLVPMAVPMESVDSWSGWPLR